MESDDTCRPSSILSDTRKEGSLDVSSFPQWPFFYGQARCQYESCDLKKTMLVLSKLRKNTEVLNVIQHPDSQWTLAKTHLMGHPPSHPLSWEASPYPWCHEDIGGSQHQAHELWCRPLLFSGSMVGDWLRQDWNWGLGLKEKRTPNHFAGSCPEIYEAGTLVLCHR